ncbi:cupin domain-containing protein [Megasphaera sp. UBA4382]|uniref:cupin domain-containing protein n=1 Tax=Megasphaera sp. UBA4382 TaxID=1946850 RepID=UPI0025C1D4B7|nr:cupin domain-containing protein [Megasphaera sp. UBA4382]
MKESAGKIFSIARDNQPVPGCTISSQEFQKNGYTFSYFSMAAHTDISAESYAYPKWLYVLAGTLTIYTPDGILQILQAGDSILTPRHIPVGMKAEIDTIYSELTLQEESTMNDIIKEGNVFQLANLVPYQDGKIINMDIISDPKLKFVVMSLAAGTGLSEHAAPGEALVFALDGTATITYEGTPLTIHKGETIKFAAGARHAVQADDNFKMALLLTLK